MNVRSLLPLAAAVLAGFAGGILSQQFIRPADAAAPGIVTAHELRIVDASGNLIADLGAIKLPGQKKPSTRLLIHADKGYLVDVGAGGIYFGRGYGKEDLGIGYSYGSSGKLSPSIFFWLNAKGRMGLMLDADKAGAPSAWMYDANGHTIWRAPASPSP